MKDVFEILAPAQWTAPLLFNSPHSGSHLPADFLAQSKLSATQLRTSEDTFVDQLFAGCVNAGAPLLRALHSRSYVDLNREPYELDPRMFFESLPGYINTVSPRVACGLGTIPRIVADGLDIHRGRITFAEALHRIEDVYRPYHQVLNTLVSEAFDATGLVLLVDCHSMPASAVADNSGFRSASPDVVLGDRFGAACDGDLAELVEKHLADAGLRVVRNRPYAGGFITETHGNPRNGRHALQIEINRSLYMNEALVEPNANFAGLKFILDQLAQRLADAMSARADMVTAYRQAAE